jgi:hypothetical protein
MTPALEFASLGDTAALYRPLLQRGRELDTRCNVVDMVGNVFWNMVAGKDPSGD